MKMLWGALVVDGRNKIGGHVASKNRAGAYLRTKVTPVNGQTDKQQAARATLATFAQTWRSLTEAQRQSWIEAAPNFPVTDIFGNPKTLSGSQLYNRLNINLAQAEQAAITTAPAAASIPSLVSLALTAAAGTPAIAVTAGIAAVPAGTTAIIFATPNYGPGQYFVKQKFRFLQIIAAAGDIDDASILTAYAAQFGNPVAGQKISVRMFLVSNTSGQAGVPFAATATVAA